MYWHRGLIISLTSLDVQYADNVRAPDRTWTCKCFRINHHREKYQTVFGFVVAKSKWMRARRRKAGERNQTVNDLTREV